MVKGQKKVKCDRGRNLKLSARSSEALELSLEVEVDDEVKEIIKSPKRCASALLDVTIIKPEDVEKLYTIHKKTLKGKEVKKFMNAMNLSKNDVRKIVENMLEANKGKSAGDHRKDYADNAQLQQKRDLTGRIKNLLLEENIFSDGLSTSKPRDNINQIYSTPKTFHQLNSMFQCKNKNKNSDGTKPSFPCACQNCAIVGVVADSQKKPFANEKMFEPQTSKVTRDCSRKSKQLFFPDDHAECQNYFRYLSSKIKTLEARLSAQEDKAVPKEYFKRIIKTLSERISKLYSPNQVSAPESSNKSRQPQLKEFSTDDENSTQKPVHKKLTNDQKPFTSHGTRPSSRKTSSSINDTPIWKWGEEVLKPGIDIKNKIVQLLEETVKNLKGPKPSTAKDDMKDVLNQMSQDLYKTVENIPEKEEAAFKRKDSHRKRSLKGDSSVNISYVNPTQWEESQMSFIMESEDENKLQSRSYYQKEFKKMISNTKEEDRFHLWQSIWCQALSNGQNKGDTVTIQIPDKKNSKRQKSVEIEYTIAELESLLVGNN